MAADAIPVGFLCGVRYCLQVLCLLLISYETLEKPLNLYELRDPHVNGSSQSLLCVIAGMTE